MVDLLKDWNPNRYMVDVEDDTTLPEQNKEEITEVITEKDEEFDFTSKELICISLTVICITIIYLLIGCLTK